MIKAILWDNDGVLVDTERLYYLATRQILATIGISLSQEQYRELFLIQGAGAWHLVEEKMVGTL
jgi:beta-phosphoglucomutase-like phosphatase (HAD superfamily)